ncbi:uncharacterized protein [Melopsittacus undulatus]|uniref:uncharacterized protein n=1 Tax=Melopsittacus undulatus TaxID=13146 RepID=UPI00146C0CA1|nr:uncharacterized protein LOC117435925 [Melopsittacus undulatus]
MLLPGGGRKSPLPPGGSEPSLRRCRWVWRDSTAPGAPRPAPGGSVSEPPSCRWAVRLRGCLHLHPESGRARYQWCCCGGGAAVPGPAGSCTPRSRGRVRTGTAPLGPERAVGAGGGPAHSGRGRVWRTGKEKEPLEPLHRMGALLGSGGSGSVPSGSARPTALRYVAGRWRGGASSAPRCPWLAAARAVGRKRISCGASGNYLQIMGLMKTLEKMQVKMPIQCSSLDSWLLLGPLSRPSSHHSSLKGLHRLAVKEEKELNSFSSHR